MAHKTSAEIKARFEGGDVPTQDDFANFIDSVYTGAISVEAFGAKGDGSTDDTAAIQAAIAGASTNGSIIASPATYNISGSIVLDAGKTLDFQGSTLFVPSTGSNSLRWPVELQAGATLKNVAIDGNFTARVAGGDIPANTSAEGVLISNQSYCTCDNVILKNLGSNDIDKITGTLCVGFTITRDVTATVDAVGNKCINCRVVDTGYDMQFGFRAHTTFANLQEGDQGFALVGTIFENCIVEGTAKTPFEVGGPDTKTTKVTNCGSIDPSGTNAFEADKGALYSTFTDCWVRGYSSVSERAFAAFRVGTSDEGDSKPKIPRNNTFINPVFIDADNDFSALFAGFADGSSVNTTWINPQMRGVTNTGSTTELYGHVVTGQLGVNLTKNVRIISPAFEGVYYGLRPLEDVDGYSVLGGYIQATLTGYEPGGDDTVTKLHLGGGLRIDCVDTSLDMTTEDGFIISGIFLENVASDKVAIRTPTGAGIISGNHLSLDAGSTVAVSRNGLNQIISDNLFDGRGMNSAADDGAGVSVVTDNMVAAANLSNQFNNTPAILFSESAPSAGTWHSPAYIYDRSPSASGTIGWVCTVEGTFETLVGVTGGMTSGTPTLTVNDASNISLNQYLAVVGAVTRGRVIAISGTTITLHTNASGTVSGAAVSHPAPTFKTFGSIAS